MATGSPAPEGGAARASRLRSRLRSRRGQVVVLLVLSAAFLGLAAFLGYRLANEKQHWVDSYQSGSWIGAQLQKEYLHLERDYFAYLHHRTAAAYDDLLLRFDIFWSRVPLIFDSYEGRDLREDAELMAAAGLVSDSLVELERLILALDPADRASLEAFEAALESIRAPVQRIAQNSLLMGPHLVELRAFVESVSVYVALVIGIASVGVLIVVFAWLQALESRRLATMATAAEREAQDARRQLLASIDSALDGFLIADVGGVVHLTNRRFREDYPELGELIAAGADLTAVLEAVVAPGDAGDARTERTAALTRRVNCTADYARWEETLADGRVLLLTQRLTERMDRVCVITDITEHKRVEAQLRDQLVAIEGASDGISITDADGCFTYMNAACLHLFGIDRPGSILGQPWQSLYSPETAAELEREAARDVDDHGHWRGEVKARRPDGTEFVQEVAITRLADGGMVGVNRDVTEQRAAVAERQALREQLFESQKMEAIGRLAGGIAHDFNNILASIIGYATFLTEDLQEESETQGFARSILRSSERAKDLVQQILAFSRKADVRRSEQNLVDLLASAATTIGPLMPPQVTFDVDLPADAVLSPVNASQFTQVLTNLAVNARDSLGAEPGRVALALSLRRIDGGRRDDLIRNADRGAAGDPVRIETEADGTSRMWIGAVADRGVYAEVRVSDTGAGIPRAVLERMFEPFFTTKPVGEGTGLGLSAVKGIVASHGGAMKVDTTPGSGTTVTVLLPLSSDGRQEGQAGSPDGAAAPSAVRGEAERADRAAAGPGPDGSDGANGDGMPTARTDAPIVLVLDDEPQVGMMIQRMLRRLGYIAAHSLTARDALALIDGDPAIGLLITDQQMPDMKGDEVVAELKRRRPTLPVLLCTGFSQKFTRQQALAAGAVGFLEKPITAKQLKIAVETALQAHTPVG